MPLAAGITALASAIRDKLNGISGEIITARGSRSTLGKRISTISNFASPNAGGAVSDRFYDAAFHAGAMSTTAGGVNRVELAPFYTSVPLEFDQIGVQVSTAAAGALGKAVIYGSDDDGWPSNLILESDVLDFSSVGSKMVAAAGTLESGRQYWFGIRSSSTATLRAIPIASSCNLGINTAAGTSYNTTIRRTLTFGTPAPETWGFNAAELTGGVNPTSVRVRAV